MSQCIQREETTHTHSNFTSLLQFSSRPPSWTASSSASFYHHVHWASTVHVQTHTVWPLWLYLLHPIGSVPLMYPCIHFPLNQPRSLPKRSSTFHSAVFSFQLLLLLLLLCPTRCCYLTTILISPLFHSYFSLIFWCFLSTTAKRKQIKTWRRLSRYV